MDSIKNLVSTLKIKDIQILEKYLKASSRSDKKRDLLRLALDKRNIDEKEASLLIYNRVSTSIRKLKERLQQDIEDFILLRFSKNKLNNTYYNNISNSMTTLLIAQHYLQLGLLEEALKKLRKVKKTQSEQNDVFIEFIYNQVYCDYLKRMGSKALESEIIKSLDILSELQYIQKLKICNLKNYYPTTNNEIRTDANIHVVKERGFFATCYNSLTQIKHSILKRNWKQAQEIYNKLILEVEPYNHQIPTDIYIDIRLQEVKINILQHKNIENELLLKEIKLLSIKSEHLVHEYWELQFINRFKIGEYNLCKNMLFYLSKDEKFKGSLSPEINNQWKYFEICIAFAQGEYRAVLKLISQFPGLSVNHYKVQINIRVLEIYALMLMRKEELVALRILSLKNFLKKLDLPGLERYEYIMQRLKERNNQCQPLYQTVEIDKKKSSTTDAPNQDVLGLELIPIESIEKIFQKEKKLLQYAE